MINQTVFAVSDNQAKPIHTGCLFELTDGKLTVVAVDGFRLSIRREMLENAPAEDMKFVVPGTALREIERILHEDGDSVATVCPGEKLSIRREMLENAPAEDMKFVVPGTALREIERILHEDGDSVATVCPGEKHILFALGKTTLVCRLIDGEFLNYNAAIPASFEYTVTADTRELITCLERVSLLVSEKLKNPVRITFDGSVMKMTCIASFEYTVTADTRELITCLERVSLLVSEKLKNPVRITFDGSVMKMTCITAVGKSYDECAINGSVDPLEIGFNSRYLLDALRACSDDTIQLSIKGITAVGKSYDECAINGSVDPLEIGFNSRYLLDALRACSDDTIQLSIKGALNPIVITPTEGEKYTYLVLPVRLKADA